MSRAPGDREDETVGPAGPTVPLWAREAPPIVHAADSGRDEADVCVIGAGIAGVTASYLLAAEGMDVLVVDQGGIASGETARTSAHLASVSDDRFARLESLHGPQATRLHHESHAAAIDRIEAISQAESIECGFTRLDGYLFPAASAPISLAEEAAAAARAGVAGVECAKAPLWGHGPESECIRFPRQARFHPTRYMAGLVLAAAAKGVRFRTGVGVRRLAGDGPVRAELKDGRTVTARHGIAATNVPAPIENWAGVYLKAGAYRTYVSVLGVPPGAMRDGLYWDMGDPYHYVRLHRAGDRTVVLVGGEDHKVGQAPAGGERACFDRLEAWARERLPVVGEAISRWSGQVFEPYDGMAYIGRVPTKGHHACHVITGDSGMGLTHGTLGAMLVTDLIMGRSNPWEAIYAPARRTTGAAGETLRENANAIGTLGEYLTPGGVRSVDEIRPGTGAVMREGLHKVAVYRDRDGAIHTRSAVCPHLRCVVRWNHAECSWDCPCHGSRFDAEGRVIMGPAVDDLPRA